MLNEERTKLMTKMSILEQKNGKEWIKIGDYYKSDYISLQMLKTFFSTSVSFVLIIGLIVLYQMDYLFENLNKLQITLLAQIVIVCFVCYSIIFQIIAYWVYAVRYRNAKKHLKNFKENIEKLSVMYKIEASENKD
ncbi:hypothetical protein [Anaerosacchariphilus polymeriproducens]|uniref:Uncharacterized protein n=1 Tax=Anaerosacchariphilus polymeriproducens TaxID=1812858 RepID=A0A371AR66_9FIRM|nr:hypothetical protein [Anaerosacchariphilus polymeriproducens]RDU22077.1 hypothetical protein DWV06_16225 [Anaerosacchariphilus polymeriproducens]